MRKQIQVKPDVHRLMKFMTLIEDGRFKIPTFQRDFVWRDKEKIELFDSISKEYPIGSILLWQPLKSFSNKGQIGPYKIKHLDETNYFYVLDGFQRLSTLFGCLTNPNKTQLKYNKTILEKHFTMFYNLDEQMFKMKSASSITDVPVYILIDTYEFLDYIDNLRNELREDPNLNKYIERAKQLSSTLIDYQIPSIEILGGTIKDAVDIFSRINSKGVEISSDWMLSALTSNEDGFNLGELFTFLLEDLKEYNFESIKREILVQCIQNSFGKVYFDQDLEELATRSDFQNTSIKTINSIKKAIKFLFEGLLVIDKKLLPYNNQLIFLTHFFNNVENPNSQQFSKLKEWFWITTYSNYFTIFSLSKIRLAFEQFMHFTENELVNPVFFDKSNHKFSTADLPKSVSSGSVRSKAYQLFLLNYSNGFNPINSEDIEALKLTYLYKGVKKHSNLIPLIIHTKTSEKDLPFEFKKPKEMSYLLEIENKDFREKYFINKRIMEFHNQREFERGLDERLKIIEVEEKEFVQNLGLQYSDLVN
ncbi:DUF262 domain-containing protein [Tenacibaculum dicentrarchi]|uniref:DUF262 domain-containing protein n=1 Tax=Tenacibaculum dicentrarchi TaxID=669041 RepID=UPI00351616AB